MLDTGIRLSEACNLARRDMHLITGKLMVRQGKGARDRTLWVSSEDSEAVRNSRER